MERTLEPIDEHIACIPHGYQPTETEPDNQNFIERDLYKINPLDHDWRTKNKYFSDLPVYLLKYFANKYKQIFKSKGRAAANKFLRERMEPARDRVRMVLRQYNTLPTTQKFLCSVNNMTTLSKEIFHHRKIRF